jgi:hypothetical protein
LQLVLVPTIHKELNGASQDLYTFRKATRASPEASPIGSKFSIDRLDRISLGLTQSDSVKAAMIIQTLIADERLGAVLKGVRLLIDDVLHHGLRAFGRQRPASDAACFAFNRRNKIDLVSFCPTKVNNSSAHP